MKSHTGIAIAGLAAAVYFLAVGGALLTIGGSVPREGAATPPARGTSLSERERTEIADVVRQTLLREPEIIEEALIALDQARTQAEQELQAQALAEMRHSYAFPAGTPIGNPDGTVTIVEFFDYNCGFCKQVAPAIDALRERNPDIRYVYKEFPVLGRSSQTAALAALAIHAIGGMEAYERFNRAVLGMSGPMSTERFDEILFEIGIERDALETEMGKDAHIETLRANQELAARLGIRGTPAFIIGDRLVPGAISLEQLETYVAEARTGTADP